MNANDFLHEIVEIAQQAEQDRDLVQQHIDEDTLIEFEGGTLDDLGCRSVASHLLYCSECMLRLDNLMAATENWRGEEGKQRLEESRIRMMSKLNLNASEVERGQGNVSSQANLAATTGDRKPHYQISLSKALLKEHLDELLHSGGWERALGWLRSTILDLGRFNREFHLQPSLPTGTLQGDGAKSENDTWEKDIPPTLPDGTPNPIPNLTETILRQRADGEWEIVTTIETIPSSVEVGDPRSVINAWKFTLEWLIEHSE